MLKHRTDLLERHIRKPDNKVRDLCPIFEILKEGRHRDTRTAKHSCATHTLGVTFDSGTRGPLNQ